VGVKEERKQRGELVDVKPALERVLDVGEAVGERERGLLGRRRAGFADVIPEMETGWNFGVSSTANSMVSVTIFSEGLGGITHSFWAMNSLSISFWSVPRTLSRGTPCWSASAMYIA